MDAVVNKYYNFSVMVTKLLALNALWVVFTLLGLGIFGVMPATLAMFSVTRKWAIGETDIPMFQTFWETYKKEFLKANGYGLIFTVTVYLLLVAYGILGTQTGAPYILSGYIILGLLLLMLIGITYFFPIYVHFSLRPLEYLKWPLMIGLNHPILTFVLVGGTTLIGYLLLRFVPGILLFLGPGLFAYMINRGVAKVYPFYSETKATTEESV